MAPKDTLEELLEEEIEGWEDEVKKLEKQIPGEEEDEDPKVDEEEEEEEDPAGKGDDEEQEDDELQKLKDELERLEKERRGLYKDLKAERRIRQEFGDKIGKLEALEQTVQQLLQQRQAADKNAGPKFKGIPLEFTEDGDAYIPEDKLAELSKPLQEKIENLQKSMQSTKGQMEEAAAAQAVIEQVLSEDERFPQAWNVYKGARKWVNDQVIDWQKENEIGGYISSSDALSYVFDNSLQKEFNKKFPGIDLEHIVTAEDGDYFLKRTLRSISDSVFEDEEIEEKVVTPKKKDGKFEKVLKKPNGLGAAANKQEDKKSVLEMAESLSALDALDLSDAQAEALLKALEREEKVNGITF